MQKQKFMIKFKYRLDLITIITNIDNIIHYSYIIKTFRRRISNPLVSVTRRQKNVSKRQMTTQRTHDMTQYDPLVIITECVCNESTHTAVARMKQAMAM